MILLIDNYDSFTYNLYAYIKNSGHDVIVIKNDQLTLSDVKRVNPLAIVISPGPCGPVYSGSSLAVTAMYGSIIPILGVCLGQQIIAYLFGGTICRGIKPIHGKVTLVNHNGDQLFKSVPMQFECMRYHSLIVNIDDTQELSAIAWDEAGVVMGIKHNVHHIYGIQFHPESILSTYGDIILKNFVNICHKKRRY